MRTFLSLLAGVVLGLAVSYVLRDPRSPERAAQVAGPGEAATERLVSAAGGPLAGPPRRAGADLGPEAQELLEDIRARLDAIEARLDGLDRRPVSSDPVTGVAREALRGLVVEVLDEAKAVEVRRREQEARQDELERREKERAEIRFQVAMHLNQIADDVPLAEGEREAIADAVVDLEEGRRALQAGMDPATTDPEAWQRDYEALEQDFWQRLERELGTQVAARLKEHF